MTNKSGIEQEDALLNESAAKETSLNLHIMDLENEIKQVSVNIAFATLPESLYRDFCLLFSCVMNWIVYEMSEIACFRKIMILAGTNLMPMLKNSD